MTGLWRQGDQTHTRRVRSFLARLTALDEGEKEQPDTGLRHARCVRSVVLEAVWRGLMTGRRRFLVTRRIGPTSSLP